MKKVLILVMTLLLSETAFANVTSESNDVLMKKGMWKDPTTGLIWDRCRAGFTWNGTTCYYTGNSLQNVFEFDEAVIRAREHKLGGYTDWRLPTVLELRTLVRCSKGFKSNYRKKSLELPSGRKVDVLNLCRKGSSRPTIDEKIFPNTPFSSIHSTETSTIANSKGTEIQTVSFLNGWIHSDFKGGGYGTYANYLRLVRGGTSNGDDVYLAFFENEEKENKIKSAIAEKERKAEEEKRRKEELERQRIARAKAKAEEEKARKARLARKRACAKFQKRLKIGDNTNYGMVTSLKTNIVKVQSSESECSQRDYKYKCLNWTSKVVEEWVKRSKICPND
ncbi:MAG: DUF1566 domain-containing protein [Moraxellaceae bacterium]|nr:DUF1566 domain-containing protein [Moraxellaceae bacterium]